MADRTKGLAMNLVWALLPERKDIPKLRDVAEGMGRMVGMDRDRLKNLAHNTLTLALLFGAMVSKLEENEGNGDNLPKGK